MSNPVIPVDRYEAKESGRAIQEAQNTTLEEGAKATLAFLRELLRSLKLTEKTSYVQISINDAVAYRATIRPQNEKQVRELSPPLSNEQLSYLREVIQCPEGLRPHPPDGTPARDVTIEVNGEEVFRLKNGIVERNLLTPAQAKTQTKPSPAQVAEVEVVGEEEEKLPQTSPEKSATSLLGEQKVEEESSQETEVEVVGEAEEPSPPTSSQQPAASLSGEQKQALQNLGVNPEEIQEVMQQQSQGNVPVIVVLNRKVENNVQKSSLKNNLQAGLTGFRKAVEDLSKKVFSFLSSLRDKVIPGPDRDIQKDLQNLAVVNVASKLLDRFGGKTESGKQVFDGSSFRLERQGNNLSIIAKDGRDTILSFKDGELRGSLNPKDIERFRAVERQLGQGKSRQSQAEIG
jgi:DNA-binding transcriptional MerR regulator